MQKHTVSQTFSQTDITPDQVTTAHFPAVGADEIAFALGVFVSAANGHFSEDPVFGTEAVSDEANAALAAFSPSGVAAKREARGSNARERTLDRTFAALWKHYAGHRHRASICARVLGFYYLTTSSHSTGLERWMRESTEAERFVIVDPVLVKTLAIVPLTPEGRLPGSLFFAMLGRA